MKLRQSDVENLKTELMGGDVVDLGGPDEELVFEDELAFDETGMATEEISEMDTILEDDVEDVGEIELEDEPAPAPVRRSAGAATAAVVVLTHETRSGLPVRSGARNHAADAGRGRQ